MIINIDSWHYKLMKNFFRSPGKPVPTSLCPYMRGLLYRISFFTGLGGLLTFMLSNMLFDPLVAVGIPALWAYVASFFGSLAILCGAFAAAAAVVFGGVWAYDKISEKITDYKWEKERAKRIKEREDEENGIAPKAPNVLASFIKAKHDKICPTIEFVKTEEGDK